MEEVLYWQEVLSNAVTDFVTLDNNFLSQGLQSKSAGTTRL